MIFGMSLATFTLLHVVISLAGIVSGLAVVFGWMTGNPRNSWSAFFLVTTISTSVTGFAFPFDQLLPSHIVGILSLIVLALAVLARYSFLLAGPWRRVYVITSSIALYFNVFVGVVQAFQKTPFLKALAPTQSEPPFLVAQLTVLALFVVVGTRATKRFQPLVAKPL